MVSISRNVISLYDEHRAQELREELCIRKDALEWKELLAQQHEPYRYLPLEDWRDDVLDEHGHVREEDFE